VSATRCEPPLPAFRGATVLGRAAGEAFLGLTLRAGRLVGPEIGPNQVRLPSSLGCCCASRRSATPPMLSLQIGLARQHRQQRILPQLIVVVEILIAPREAVDSLPHQLATVCSTNSGLR